MHIFDIRIATYMFLVLGLLLWPSAGNGADLTEAQIAQAAERLATAKDNIDELNKSATALDKCFSAFNKIMAGADNITADADVVACKPSDPDFKNANREGKLALVLNRMSVLAVEAKAAVEAGLDASSAPMQRTQDDPPNNDQLRLVKVRAGDNRPGRNHICRGPRPLQWAIKACWSTTHSTTKVTTFKADKQKSCVTSTPLKVEDLCGYQPSPQGLNSIIITYECGDSGEVRHYATLDNTNVSIHCDTGVLLSGAGLHTATGN